MQVTRDRRKRKVRGSKVKSGTQTEKRIGR